jgi:K+-transporting ATPase c subunit
MKKRETSLVAVATLAVVLSVVTGASYKLVPYLLAKLFVPRDGSPTSIYEALEDLTTSSEITTCGVPQSRYFRERNLKMARGSNFVIRGRKNNQAYETERA